MVTSFSETYSFSDKIDTTKESLDSLSTFSDKASQALIKGFEEATLRAKSLDDVVKTVGLSLSKIALNAALKPLQTSFSSLSQSFLSSLLPSQDSSPVSITPFAEGGIVNRASVFGLGQGLGLMGEKGAEAIIPLSRGSDGRLGLATPSPGYKKSSVNISISTQDSESFKKSQVQIASLLSQAVAQGERGL